MQCSKNHRYSITASASAMSLSGMAANRLGVLRSSILNLKCDILYCIRARKRRGM
jgi:hypothetical protein